MKNQIYLKNTLDYSEKALKKMEKGKITVLPSMKEKLRSDFERADYPAFEMRFYGSRVVCQPGIDKDAVIGDIVLPDIKILGFRMSEPRLEMKYLKKYLVIDIAPVSDEKVADEIIEKLKSTKCFSGIQEFEYKLNRNISA